MKNQELVSVIIPVYNSEADIRECITSLMQQTYSNFEVIIINDGSTDKTKIICDSLAEENEKITVISQENGGVSLARNTGIRAVAGDWIVFLDADDKMDPETIEKAWKLAKEKACDTVCWNCYKEYEGEISKCQSITPDNIIFQGDKKLALLIEALYQTRIKTFYPGYMFRAVWGKLLSAKVIKENKIIFPVGQPLGEDAAFLVDYFKSCNKVLLVNKYWNFYKITSSSAVRKFRSNLKEIQNRELQLLCEKIQSTSVDVDTVVLNQCLQFDYQYMHHLYQKEENFFVILKEMKAYIRERKYRWKHFSEYDRSKIHKNSLPVVWTMVHNFVCPEAFLCMLREQKHR